MNPITKYYDFIMRTGRVQWPTHEIELQIHIKKGEKSGFVEIPCNVMPMGHTVDLNPSLLKTHPDRTVTETKLPRDVPIAYHPEDGEELKLEPNEEIKWTQEVERCGHCGQKLVIAEVGERAKERGRGIRFNNDPVFEVTLSDPAPRDVMIPIKVGLFLRHIKDQMLVSNIMIGAFTFLSTFISMETIFGVPQSTVSAPLTAVLKQSMFYANIEMLGLVGVVAVLALPTYAVIAFRSANWLRTNKDRITLIPKDVRGPLK